MSTELYKGPIIGDLIEELQHSFYHCGEHGVDFVPAISPPPVKKKNSGNRHERVPKSHNGICRNKTNRSNYIYGKQSVKENGNKLDRNPAPKSADTNLLIGQATWNKFSSDGAMVKQAVGSIWEKDTASILEGATITKLSNNNNLRGD